MDWPTFLKLRAQRDIRKWYDRLARQAADRQTRFRQRFKNWERRKPFLESLKRRSEAAHTQGLISMIQLGEFHRSYLRDYFELFACDHFNAKSVQKGFETPQRMLEFLCAQEEIISLVEALDLEDFEH